MLLKQSFYCTLLLFFIACGKVKGPEISREKMEHVLLDVQLAEVYSTMAAKDSTESQGLKNDDSLAVYYKEIFDHHQVTAQQFMHSLDWYRAHPDELDSIFAHSLRTLDKMERNP
jgi:hypothetical protein